VHFHDNRHVLEALYSAIGTRKGAGDDQPRHDWPDSTTARDATRVHHDGHAHPAVGSTCSTPEDQCRRDTSTNDTVVLFINGASEDGSSAHGVIDEARNLAAFVRFCQWDSELVQLLVLGGEGTTKSALLDRVVHPH
jgi:hypothetical protein